MNQEKKSNPEQKIAVILVRGFVGVSKPIKDTLLMLHLRRKNNCVILPSTPEFKGMIQKVKDYVTWGEIDEEVFKELVEKKGSEYKGRLSDRKEKYKFPYFELNGKKYKKYFRLNPPKKGFGRKGIKIPFKVGGGLGSRGEEINDLIQRML